MKLFFRHPKLRPRRIPSPKTPVPPMPIKFNFGYTERRSLVPLSAAAMFLNLTTREVLALLEEGSLRWSFDIRTRASGRREVRVLRQSLFDFAGLCPLPRISRAEPSEFRQIVDLILPEEIIAAPNGSDWKTKPSPRLARNFHQEMRLGSSRYHASNLPKEPVLRATEIADCFACLPQHVTNLIRDQFFQVLDLPLGLKASPFVTRESVIQFLEARRLS